MRHRYFIIEPRYADPDVFCEFRLGSGRIHASIQIYANLSLLQAVAEELEQPKTVYVSSSSEGLFDPNAGSCFDLNLSVSAGYGVKKILRCQVFQDYLEDGAPFRADIRFDLTPEEACDFASGLKAWCAQPTYPWIWKGD